MIEQNYYQGFTKLCDRNQKMTRIPSKDELERVGCQITGMCYLITKDGMQYNPTVVNPELFSDDLRALFTTRPEPKIVYETDGKDEFKEQPKGEPAADVKICPECHKQKPIDSFGKKAGRGGKCRKDICMECEKINRTKALEDIAKLEQHQKEETTNEPIQEETTTPSAFDSVVFNTDYHPRYVTVEYCKKMAIKAYEKGKEDGKIELTIIEPTLNDLLGA